MISGRILVQQAQKITNNKSSFFTSHGKLVTLKIPFSPDRDNGKFLWQEYDIYLNRKCLPLILEFDKDLHTETLHLIKGFNQLASYTAFVKPDDLTSMSFTDKFINAALKWQELKHLGKDSLSEKSDGKLINHCLEMVELGIKQFNYQVYYDSEKPQSDYFILRHDISCGKTFYREPNILELSVDNLKLDMPSVRLSRNIE